MSFRGEMLDYATEEYEYYKQCGDLVTLGVTSSTDTYEALPIGLTSEEFKNFSFEVSPGTPQEIASFLLWVTPPENGTQMWSLEADGTYKVYEMFQTVFYGVGVWQSYLKGKQ